MAIVSHGTGPGCKYEQTDVKRRHIGHPKPDIVEASVSVETMTDILGLIGPL